MIRMLRVSAGFVICFTVVVFGQDHIHAQCTDSLMASPRPDGTLYLTWQTGDGTEIGTIRNVCGTSQELLTGLNPILLFRDIAPCDMILAPLDTGRMLSRKTQGAYPLWYKVRPGETAYFITRRMFGVNMDDFLALNDLDTYNIREGQTVMVGWLPKGKSDDGPIAGEQERWYYTIDEDLTRDESDSLEYMTQRGVALWNKSKPDPHLFALHRDAPLNTYIEITNPMFGRTVRAKVIGTIPPTYPEDICIIVSEGVARQLGALDSRFYAEMSYVVR